MCSAVEVVCVCSWVESEPSQQALFAAMCMTIDAALITYGWAKYGACMVRDSDGYLEVAGILWRSLPLPLPNYDADIRIWRGLW